MFHCLVNIMIKVENSKMYTLRKSLFGKHTFGGPPKHKGATPVDSAVSTHLLLTLDLRDKKLPFSSDSLRYLPLYFPLKYGYGGPSMQYSVISDDEIKIHYLSNPVPDSEDSCYVKVSEFPRVRFSLGDLIENDDPIDWFTITVGGEPTLDHKPDQCLNATCIHYKTEPNVDLICSLPPIKFKRSPDIWWEFEGAYLLFYFWLCRGCNSIITSNRAT